jgi:hypothetical protein
MRKKTKALSGAAQDAYFRRVLKANPNLSADERDQLVRKLRQEVAQLRVRLEPRGAEALAGAAATCPAANPKGQPRSRADPPPPAGLTEPPVTPVAPPFDPFSPNIIVLLRKAGREAALAALNAIDSTDNLRLLAREQRLTIGADVSSAAELRTAIVTAAERRIANRMAAAS